MIMSGKEAKEILSNVPDDAMIFLDVVNIQSFIREPKRKIKRIEGEELIDSAKKIQFTDNDFCGVLSLYGIHDRNNLHNLLFPLLE